MLHWLRAIAALVTAELPHYSCFKQQCCVHSLLQFDVGELEDSSNNGGSPGAKQRLRAALAARLRGLTSPSRILLRDKLAFLLGSCQLWCVAKSRLELQQHFAC
jgi:hypothetical protein